MELRDIYDENKRPTGQVIQKGDVIPAGGRVLCVGCWIVNRKGEIFITKRAPTKRFMPDKWENSGGHAVSGEDGKAAALREVFEETGIRAEKEDLILLAERREADFFGEDYAMVKDFALDAVTLQEGETVDAKWVTIEQWEQMLENGEIAPSIKAAIAPFKEKLLKLARKYAR